MARPDPFGSTLTEAEVAEAIEVAAAINLTHRRHGDRDQLNAGRGGENTVSQAMDRLGQLGDRLACKVLGMAWITRERQDRQDDGYDSLLLGEPIEVKTTTCDPRRDSLIVKDLSRLNALVLVMVRYDEATRSGRCTGWIAVKEFKARHRMRSFVAGAPEQHYMKERDLRPMETLRPMLEQYVAARRAPRTLGARRAGLRGDTTVAPYPSLRVHGSGGAAVRRGGADGRGAALYGRLSADRGPAERADRTRRPARGPHADDHQGL